MITTTENGKVYELRPVVFTRMIREYLSAKIIGVGTCPFCGHKINITLFSLIGRYCKQFCPGCMARIPARDSNMDGTGRRYWVRSNKEL
jgi:hypothetical protein